MTEEDAMKWALKWALLSPDPNTKCGCVVLSHQMSLISVGWNDFPPGIEVDHRLLDRPLKNRIIVHAEENALVHAGVRGVHMYLTMVPCSRCVRLILVHGVREVVYLSGHEYEQRFEEDVKFGMDLMLEANVNVHALGKSGPWICGKAYPS